jgi:hypothetical protein
MGFSVNTLTLERQVVRQSAAVAVLSATDAAADIVDLDVLVVKGVSCRLFCHDGDDDDDEKVKDINALLCSLGWTNIPNSQRTKLVRKQCRTVLPSTSLMHSVSLHRVCGFWEKTSTKSSA